MLKEAFLYVITDARTLGEKGLESMTSTNELWLLEMFLC